MSSLSDLSATVVKSTVQDITGRYDMGNFKTLVASLRLLDKMSNGTINNPIAEVSMARKRGEDVSKILTPGDMYRKQFGECFTPKELISDMLDKLPRDVWTHKDYKWLDNSVGGGNFLVQVMTRLMVSLTEQIPNEAERKKYIIEKMLYFVDMQAKNVFFTMQRLGGESDYDFNYHVGDSLEFDYWGWLKFDVVVGNPPFNDGIDLKFLSIMIEKLNPKHIVIVHPSTYILDMKENSRFGKVKKMLGGKLKSVKLFNGNPVFNISLAVPCAIINYDNTYNGKCAVEYFDQKFESDVWNITKFGAEWETIVKPFKTIIDIVCINQNSIWDMKVLDDCRSEKKGKHYCQIANVRGHESKTKERMVVDDFYTTVLKDTNECKGIRNTTARKDNYIVYEFNTAMERDNFIEYNKTYFFRFCLSILKNAGVNGYGNMSLIPWLDFTQSWDDAKLFKHFNVDKKTQEYIYNFLPDYYNLGNP
jgi:hypothetical protein